MKCIWAFHLTNENNKNINMKAIIAEKPSVAREIASLLGASEKKDGYLTGNGYCVTWAFGHLIGLGMPEDYGISGFQKASLPILPNPFLLTVRKVKKSKSYVADTGALKQLKIIEQVFNQCESVIVATDAGREGELIFRYIYEYLKCNKPFERLWISSLTEKAIKQGFENLKNGKEFNGLYQSAQGRSQADWLVGINATQALSIVAGNGIYSLGRVQTPALALICKRYLDNKNFSIKKYYQIQLLHHKEMIAFKSLSTTKWDDKMLADDALRTIERNGNTATVTSVEIKNVTEQPPLLFDLTGLQKEANNKLNLSAEETLNLAQSLYEKKFVTYPRTGSKYIPEDVWTEIPNLVRALQVKETCKQAVSKMKLGRFNKRIVNDLRVTDHHGLLITEKIPSALSAKENAVYDMIAFRLLEALSQSCIKEITNVELQVLHCDFIAKGSKVIEAGWRSIKGSFSDNDTETLQDLPELKKGDELKIKEAIVLEKETIPPILYTEAGLLSAMESAGKKIQNEEERKALQNIGIGTPATRASIIETLFTRNYIEREKKSLIPTEKGLQVYELVKDRKIADVAMTAEWELALQKIENNEADARAFQKEMETYAKSITNELLQTNIIHENLPQLICPKCKTQQLIIRDKIVKCSDEVCNWLQFRNVCGLQISIADIESLVKKGKTALLKGMKSKAGKKFDAYIVLNDKAESSFEFEKNKSYKK
jgi:DNA topoisomerase III